MKKNFIVSLLCALFCFPFSGFSQNTTPASCGVSMEDQLQIRERLFENKARFAQIATQRGATTYVAVRFILVADSDGDNRSSPQRAFQALCLLNNYFIDQDIVFYIKELRFDLNFTGVNNDPGGNTSAFNIIPNYLDDKYDALNFFITRKIDNDGSSTGTLGYYLGPNPNNPSQFPNDYIVVKQSRILDPNVTPHEVGHFFSLNHPHFGWDGNQWNPNIHGNPTQPNSPAPFDFIPTEKMDGSNCNIAGDGLCDTPPDYLFGFGWPTGDCEYTDGPNNHPNAGALDPDGTPVDPDETNVMGYFFGCGDYHFSEQQKNVVFADLMSGARQYIRPNYTPTEGQINGTTTLLSPEDGTNTDAYNQILLQWEAVPGATEYLLEVDRFTSFSLEPQYYFVSGTSFLLTDALEPERKYYWRVTPFNESNTCVEPSDEFDFTTGTAVATQEIPAVKGIAVFPNPTSTTNGFTVNIESDEDFSANFDLITITGQTVISKNNQVVPKGQSNISINTNDLTPGIYILSVQSDKGRLNKRIVINQ